MRSGNSKSYWLLALFLITGAILGGILGEIISNSAFMVGIAPYLVKTFPIFDIPPITINLYVIKLVLGLALYPNLISIIGIIGAILLFRRF
ncbi:MAG: DUF4321 domain-containing protein [Pelosinus sp.]|nr:DUF4321 domain-containing protein [Pelosinus sp.]